MYIVAVFFPLFKNSTFEECDCSINSDEGGGGSSLL